jgi:hypothetical protein
MASSRTGPRLSRRDMQKVGGDFTEALKQATS